MGGVLSACGLWRRRRGPKQQSQLSSSAQDDRDAAAAGVAGSQASVRRRRPVEAEMRAFRERSPDPEAPPSRLQSWLSRLRISKPWSKNSAKSLKPVPPVTILQNNAAYNSLNRAEQLASEGHMLIQDIFQSVASLEKCYMSQYVQVAPADDPYIRTVTQWSEANKSSMLDTFAHISKLKAEYMDKLCQRGGSAEFSLPRSLTNPFDHVTVKRRVAQLENAIAIKDSEIRLLKEKSKNDVENHKRVLFQLSKTLQQMESEKKKLEDKFLSPATHEGAEDPHSATRISQEVRRPERRISEIEEVKE